MEDREGIDNFEAISAIHKEELQEKGKHSFPYKNSMKNKLRACTNCCLNLIFLMLKILDLLRNKKISEHRFLKVMSRHEISCHDILTHRGRIFLSQPGDGLSHQRLKLSRQAT